MRFLSLLIVCLLAAMPAMGQSQWPAGKVVFTDSEDLQQKFDAGDLGGGGVVANTPIDTDNDGQNDYVLVGDQNADGLFGSADVNYFISGVGALTDTKTKTVELQAGHWRADAVDTVCASSDGQDGIILFDGKDEWVLLGQGGQTTWLHGTLTNDADDNCSNVFAVDSTRIRFVGLAIDGESGIPWDASTITDSFRMGIHTTRCDDCSIIESYAREVMHDNFLMVSGDNNQMLGLLAEDSGAFHDTSGAKTGDASFYIFSRPGEESTDALVRGVSANNVGSCASIRSGGLTSFGGSGLTPGGVKRPLIEGIACDSATNLNAIVIGGTVDGVFRGITTKNAGLISTHQNATAYLDANSGTSYHANENLLWESLISIDAIDIGIRLYDYQDGITVKNATVEGSAAIGFIAADTLRGNAQELTVLNAGTAGVQINSQNAGDSWFNIDGCTITSNGSLAAMYLPLGLSGVRITGCKINDPGGAGIKTLAQVYDDVVFDDIIFDMLPRPLQFKGEGLAATITALPCGADQTGDWAVITNATSNTDVGGGGAIRNRAECNGTAWADWLYPQVIPMALNTAMTSCSNLRFNEIRVDNGVNGHDGSVIVGIEMAFQTCSDTGVTDVVVSAEGKGVAAHPMHMCVRGAALTGTTQKANIVGRGTALLDAACNDLP